MRELDGLILTGGGDLYFLPVRPDSSPANRDARCVARRVGALRRATGLAALHPHAGHLPGDATHECGAGRDALPGPASRMAERAATTAAPSRARAGLFLQLEHASHSIARPESRLAVAVRGKGNWIGHI